MIVLVASTISRIIAAKGADAGDGMTIEAIVTVTGLAQVECAVNDLRV